MQAFVFFIGLIITMGSTGGLDNAADSELLSLTVIACVGLALMGCGVSGLNSKKF